MSRKWRDFPVVVNGLPYILTPALITVILGLWGKTYLFLPFCLLTLFTVSFFRNPHRDVPNGSGLVLSPADGKIVTVEEVDETPLVGGKSTKVSIFMSIFNVHVNRFPVGGTVADVNYQPGRFVPAMSERATRENEQNRLMLQSFDGLNVVFVQVAGILARRIVCYVSPGDRLQRGEVFGAILFGSRVDVYVPPEVEVRVRQGDRVKGGESTLGVIR